MFKCECGAMFEYPKEVEESRGEFWGIPCTETMYYCPECGDDCFYAVKFVDVYGTEICEFDEYYEFGKEKVAAINLQDYLSENKYTA